MIHPPLRAAICGPAGTAPTPAPKAQVQAGELHALYLHLARWDEFGFQCQTRDDRRRVAWPRGVSSAGLGTGIMELGISPVVTLGPCVARISAYSSSARLCHQRTRDES